MKLFSGHHVYILLFLFILPAFLLVLSKHADDLLLLDLYSVTLWSTRAVFVNPEFAGETNCEKIANADLY